MELTLIILLLFTSIGFVAYHISNRKLVEEVHLPSEITGPAASGLKAFSFNNILSGLAGFIERLFGKSKHSLPTSNLHKRLVSSNKIMSPGQFMVFKFQDRIVM